MPGGRDNSKNIDTNGIIVIFPVNACGLNSITERTKGSNLTLVARSTWLKSRRYDPILIMLTIVEMIRSSFA